MRAYRNGGVNCKDYERLWEGHCVDKELKDEWLVALNELTHFRLNSICVGHEKRRGIAETNPAICIEMRMDHRFPKRFNSQSGVQPYLDKVHNHLIELFPSDVFDTNYQINFEITSNSKIVILDRFLIRVNSVKSFRNPLEEGKREEWFDSAVNKIKEIDSCWFEYIDAFFPIEEQQRLTEMLLGKA